MVDGSLRVLLLLPPLKLVIMMTDIAEILLKVALKHNQSIPTACAMLNNTSIS
jgi:hypothetical protein